MEGWTIVAGAHRALTSASSPPFLRFSFLHAMSSQPYIEECSLPTVVFVNRLVELSTVPAKSLTQSNPAASARILSPAGTG